MGGYGELSTLEGMYESLESDEQTRRLNDTTPTLLDASNEWDKARTRLKLCNVPWDTDYNNVVAWPDDDTRDRWFDALDGDIIELDTAWNYKSLEIFKPSLGKYEGEVRVPVPYEEAMGYNYLYVDMYDQPVEEYGGYKRSHFYYHVTGINKLAANTVVLTLELDAWTEYMNSAHVESLDLARGHWPAVQTDPETWLADPLASPVRLDEPEPDLPTVQAVVSYEKYVPLYDDNPLVLIAMTTDMTRPGTPWATGGRSEQWWINPGGTPAAPDPSINSSVSTWPPLPISSAVERVSLPPVNGYDPVDGAPSVSADTSGNRTGGDPGALYLIGLEPDAFGAFMRIVNGRYPELLDAIKAVYVVPSRYVDVGASHTLDGATWRPVRQQPAWHLLESVTVTPALFGYPAKAAQWAKLYTSQFASIEVSDLNGRVSTIGVEDIRGALDVHARASALYPWLKMEAFVDGVGGRGIKDYAVRPLDRANAAIPQGLWESLRMEYDIPTYTLYADPVTSTVNTLASRRTANDRANKARQSALVGAAVAKATGDTDANAAYNDSVASATVSRDNANRSNDTTQSNAMRSAQTERANASASESTRQANTARDISTDDTTGNQNFDYTHDSTQRGIDYQRDMRDIELSFGQAEYDKQSAWMNDRYETKKTFAQIGIPLGTGLHWAGEKVATWLVNSATDNDQTRVADPSTGKTPPHADTDRVAGNGIAASDGIEVGGSTPGGDTVAFAAWAVQMAGQEALVTSKMDTMFGWDHEAIGWARNQLTQQTNQTVNRTVSYNETQNEITRDNNRSVLAQHVSTRRADNSATNSTTMANIQRSYGTATANASDSHGTQSANIGNDYARAMSSAAMHADTAHANIDTRYSADVWNAELAYASAKRDIAAETASAKAGPARLIGDDSGDGTRDQLAQRGVDIRTRRVKDADALTAANTFARWGYRMPPDTWIDSPKLDLRDSYTYWQARDVWLTTERMSETAKGFLRSMLMRGVTVWHDPDRVLQGGLG
jgi:hypothetical protein